MKRVLTTAAAGVLVAIAAAAPAHARSCGTIGQEGFSPANISAIGVDCTSAKKLAKLVSKSGAAGFDGCVILGKTGLRLKQPCVRLRYRCRTLRRTGSGDFGIRIGCKRGSSRTVNWDLE